MIGYKTLAKGEIDLNQVIQHPQNLDLHLYLNTNEKFKSQFRQEECSTNDIQKRLVGYVSIVSLTSTIPNEYEIDITSNPLSIKHHHHQFGIDKSFNDDDEYIEEEELNSELEDSDIEFNSKIKQKFNRNILRNKFIQMFKRKTVQSTTNSTKNSERIDRNRQSDIEEEDPPSDISDSTIPVDQWSIESVPKPGFTPVEHLQILNCTEDEHRSTIPFDSNDSPIDSDTSETDIDRPQIIEKSLQPSMIKNRDTAMKQLEEFYTNDRLPESIIFLYTGLNQSNVDLFSFQKFVNNKILYFGIDHIFEI
jgi:hypothetical protein